MGDRREALCRLEKVCKSYRMGSRLVEVLRGVDLLVEEGDFLAIMGPSGSGKTTLMNILGCLDVATTGRYWFAGRNVNQMNDDELSKMRARHIGFVFQLFHLLPYATVLENVMLPALYGKTRFKGKKKRAVALLRAVGLDRRAHFKPSQLSGGEQQRVAIARALMNGPRLILADEPTGALDSKTAGEIMELLVDLNRKGRTIIVVTHNPDVAKYTSKIIGIRDGLLVPWQE